MSTYIQQAQDPELKQMLQEHLPLHVQDYNLKIEFIQSELAPNISKFQQSILKPILASYTEAPSQKYVPVTPSVTGQAPTDRAIATGYLLNQKSSALNYAGSLLECGNPA